MDVLDDGRPLDDAIATHAGFHKLDPRARGHARMLVATVLRRKGEFDRLLATVMDRPAPEKAMHVLRLGIADLRVLNTPDHAAVDNAVCLAQAGGLGGLAGLVNAVLRRIAAEGDALAERHGISAVRDNLPRWLRASWEASYGVEATDAIAEVLLREPPIDICVAKPRDVATWAERLGGRAVGARTVRIERAEGGVDRLEDLPTAPGGCRIWRRPCRRCCWVMCAASWSMTCAPPPVARPRSWQPPVPWSPPSTAIRAG
ncbi:transcription antitermination factor NusB [Tistrella bauzanensis]